MRALLVLLACGAVCYGGPALLRLGFYHDDWTFLSVLHFAGGGLLARAGALAHDIPALIPRPTIIPVYALGHGLFGLDPLGWQLSLLAVNLLLGLAVYALVARFGGPRRIALAAAALYLAYPSKDATMFWPGAIVCSLSFGAFLAAYLAHLDFVRAGAPAKRVLAVALLVFSLSTYELALFMIPLFLLAPSPLSREDAARRRRGFLDAAAVAVLLLAYKFLLAPRLGAGTGKTLQLSPLHALWTYAAAANAVAGPKLVLYVLRAAWKTAISAPWLAAAAAAIGVFLWKREPGEKSASGANRRALLLLGAGTFLLACLPLALSDYTPTPVNHQNRINQAFLLGPVLMLAAQLAGARARKLELAALAVLALFLTAHAGFASVWAESYARQLELRDLLRANAAALPKDAVLLVRPRERYIEDKAPVFDAHWDTTGAARIWTGNPDLRAAAVRPGQPEACGADAMTALGAARPYGSVRLLDAKTGRLTAPGPAECRDLLVAP